MMRRADFLRLLGLGTAGVMGFGGCRTERRAATTRLERGVPADRLAPQRASGTGETHEIQLRAQATELDLGNGKRFDAFAYDGKPSGREIRVKEGDTLRVALQNDLPEATTIHWHGVPVPNPMDGVEDVTQKAIPPGQRFVYEFPAWPAGTYLYHSHASYQLDQGLHSPLIIEARADPGVDEEFVLMVSDWATVDGGGPAASRAGRTQQRGGMMMGGGMMGGSGNMGPGTGMAQTSPGRDLPLLEPIYDLYVCNGLTADAAGPMVVSRGDRVRLRLINASSASTYHLRLTGHQLIVTHADGRPVRPVEVGALRIGMGERYDVEFTAGNPGRWRLLCWPDSTAAGPVPLRTLLYRGVQSRQYNGDSSAQVRLLAYDDLQAVEEPALPQVGSKVDRVVRMVLSGGMMGSRYWTINGQVYPDTEDITVHQGERVRFEYSNHSMMVHPMHLHGHFFELDLPGRPRKDTVLVEPHMGFMALEFVADNPGAWFHHCHNLYHQMAGLANVMRFA